MSQRHVDWNYVVPRVLLPPLMSVILGYLLIVLPAVLAAGTTQRAVIKCYEATTSNVENYTGLLILIICVQVVLASILYIVAKLRRRRLMRLGLVILTSLLCLSTCSVGLYTLALLLVDDVFVHIVSLCAGFLLGAYLTQILLRGVETARYLAVCIVAVLASLNIVIWLPPQLVLLLLLAMPVVDILLVYAGPVGKLVRLMQTRRQEDRVATTSTPAPVDNPILRLTVKLDGILLGIGDFLLYSLAAMWSLLVLADKLGLMTIAVLLVLHMPLFILSFYLNMQMCIRRGYGPATVGPLLTLVGLTLLCYYLL